MKRIPPRSVFCVSIDLALLVLCALHVPSLGDRAQAPFSLTDSGGRMLVSRIISPGACPQLRAGDEILFWERERVREPSVIEFLADPHTIGDTVAITYRSVLPTQSATVTLIPAYTLSYSIIVCLVALITWCIGVFVLLERPKDLTAAIMHWSMISMAVVVVVAFEGVTPHSILGYLSSILFFVSYTGVPTTFLLLTTLFPQPRFGPTWLKSLVIFPPAYTLTAIMINHHYRAVMLSSAADFNTYLYWFGVFHLLLLIYIGAGILIFVYSYVTTVARDARRKLKWVLWGLCIGPTPFLLLSIMPQAFHSRELLPEAYTLIFLVIIPIAFAIALVRHHLLDVEVVISRSTVYVILITALLVLYVLVVTAVASMVGQITASAAAAVIVALLFEPARVRVQHFVDRSFFRVRYNYREAERVFVERIKRCLGIQQLAELVVEKTEKVIPVERIGFFALRQPNNRLQVLSHTGFDFLEEHGIRYEPENLKTRLELPIALDERIEAGVTHESADAHVFHRWGMALVLPMLSEKGESMGFLVLGQKKAGTRFSLEDVDLLKSVAAQSGLAVERILLQQQLMMKDQETERLKALNQLKSDFISIVSHEFRTPLTSIKLFAELLRKRQRTRDGKSQEFLQIIEGESERLDRMVTTILDSAKIEEGLKEYQFSDVDFREIAEHVMRAMQYQLQKQHFRTTVRIPKRPVIIRADPDAVAQAIINLMTNSIKYSSDRKYLSVTITRTRGGATCRIRDRGKGISPDAIPHMFERFYRDPKHSHRVPGVGLGLFLVKHIMDAHGGKVELKSSLGKGTEFSLSFPLQGRLREPKEKNPDR